MRPWQRGLIALAPLGPIVHGVVLKLAVSAAVRVVSRSPQVGIGVITTAVALVRRSVLKRGAMGPSGTKAR
jgi:hypothetical protein